MCAENNSAYSSAISFASKRLSGRRQRALVHVHVSSLCNSCDSDEREISHSPNFHGLLQMEESDEDDDQLSGVDLLRAREYLGLARNNTVIYAEFFPLRRSLHRERTPPPPPPVEQQEMLKETEQVDITVKEEQQVLSCLITA